MLKLITTSHQHINDKDLVQKICEGDQSSIDYLVRKYGETMLITARKITKNEADAEDCVQQAFMNAFKHMSQFNALSSLSAWLKRIVTNTALMHLRSQSRKKEEPIDTLIDISDKCSHHVKSIAPYLGGASTEYLTYQEEVRQEIQTAIERLPSNYRDVVIARDISGYDTKETASLLNISAALVRTRLHRARALLKTLLEPFYNAEAA